MPQGLLPFTSEHPHQRFLENQPGCLTRTKRRFFYVLDGNPRRLKTVFLLLLAICFIFYLLFFFFVSSDVIEETPSIVLPDSLIEKRVDFKAVTIDKICSQTSSICYSVVDKKTDKGTVERHLFFSNSLPEESDSAVVLIPPKGESFDTSDTRIWNIDHQKFIAQYIAGMFITPFMLSVLPLHGTVESKSLLEIGLGGGSLDMALHTVHAELNITAVEMDPTIIQIAEKWFGVVSNDKHRTVAADGVSFVKEMVNRKEKVDIIVLDACSGDVDLPCPAESFREKQVVQTFLDALNPSGVLIVNILAHDKDEAAMTNARRGIASFTDVFPACLQLNMSQEINIILACLTQEIGDTQEQLKFYRTRLQTALTTFKLQDTIGSIAVASTI